MFFRRIRPAHSDSPRELERLSAALDAALDRLGRGLGKHRSGRKAGQSRGTHVGARLSSLPGQRPFFKAKWNPLRLPKDYRRGMSPTALSRERDRNGRPSYALEVKARAEGVAERLRQQLYRLRGALAGVRDRFRGRRSLAAGRRMRGRIGLRSSTGSDRVITALVLATTIGLGLDVLGTRAAAAAIQLPRVVTNAAPVVTELDLRIDEVADAIAVAEGYFAKGPYDGATLLYVLNNPGGLKKPALGAGSLPTWKGTGLVRFPTPEAGWAALRYQVRLMLTGASGIYAPTDSLISVGEKYTNGDANWGVNVATRLGVPPARTLAELMPRE